MTDGSTVMIVGDDQETCTSLAQQISASTGLRGAVVSDLGAARSFCATRATDVAMAIVDTGLPNGQGYALCADLVQAHKGLPVMMVSKAYSEAEALDALRAGAIDYLPRPHQHAEFAARLRAHIRSRSTSLEVQLTVGPFQFYPGPRLLVDKRKKRIWLTDKETRMLRRLYIENGRTVTTEDLVQAAWGVSDGSRHTLHTHVYRLRCKLGGGEAGRALLVTVPGGYMLDAQAARLAPRPNCP